MKIILDPRKSLMQNIASYREEAKKYRSKATGAEKAILETIKESQKQTVQKTLTKKKREWVDAFHHFLTSKNSLVIGGRNAKQNDVLFAKHCSPNEWFLHADIRGSPAVVVKNPASTISNTPPAATDAELQEAAQFTASFSSAWKRGFGNVDVYAVLSSQVSKHSHGGYIDQGGFAINGERKWFKNTLLGLYICLNEETLQFSLRPILTGATKLCIKILPGDKDKNAASKAIKAYFAKKLFESGKKAKLDETEIAKLLPGNCEVVIE